LSDVKDPTLLDNPLTDGGKIDSPKQRPLSTPQKHYLYASGTNFYYRLSKPQGLERPEGLGKLKKFLHLIGSRTRDLTRLVA
jgi:hypothetical protein